MPRKADLPLHGNKGRVWDGPGARRRMVNAAKDADGNIKFEEAAQGFTYFTGDRSSPKQGDFKSPFADIVNGRKQVIYRGVIAAIGRNGSVKGVSAAEKATGLAFLERQRDRFPKDSEGEVMEGTVLEFQTSDNQRGRGRVLVASGNPSRNRDFWTGKHYRLVPGGMRMESWQKNPLIFYMHNLGIPLAQAEMFIEDGQLWAWDNFEFHRQTIPVLTRDGFGEFDTGVIADLWEDEFLNAVSIHIILSKQDEANVIEAEEEIIIPTSEIIEASIVTVPGDADAGRERQFLEELEIRLRAKGVEQEMAQCVACSFGSAWTPSLPVWVQNSVSTAKEGSVISVPEVSMSKKKAEEATLEVAEEAVEAPEETAEEATAEATLEVAEEVVVEQEFQLSVGELAEAIANDEPAMRALAASLLQMPEFVHQIATAASAHVQQLEPVVQEAPPQRIIMRLVATTPSEDARVEQPAQPVAAPTAITQATEGRAAPVPLPAGANGHSRDQKLGVLNLLPPARSG